MAHLALPTNCLEAPNIVPSEKVKLLIRICQYKKSVLMARLKDDKSVIFLISTGRAFLSRGPATEKALLQTLSWYVFGRHGGMKPTMPWQ